MPIYAYKCADCGHQLEQLQKVGAPLLVDCPQCNQPSLVKQLTAAGFQLKGSGWYVTDFRDKPQVKKDGAAPAKDGDGAPDKATADKPATDKPAESKPAEAKPAESKPDTAVAAGQKDKTAKTEKASGAGSAAPAPSPTPPPAGNSGSNS